MRSYNWLLKPRSWVLIPMLLVLALAVACGSDSVPTPQPTPTPVDITGIVQQAIEQAGTQGGGVSADDVAKAIQTALAAQPGGATTQDVATAIANALKSQPGITSADVANAITTALATQPGVTAEDLAKAIETAVASNPGLTKEDLANAVTQQLAQLLPTPTAIPGATPTPDTSQPKFGGNVPMQLYAPPFGDFLWKGSAPTAVWADPVFNRLIEFNPETPDLTDVRGDLAEDWSLAADGLTYTFKLRQNVTFQDGAPLTAEDVLFSFQLMTDCQSILVVKDVCPWNSSQLSLFAGYYDSSRALDSHTVELKTKFTAPAFLTNLSRAN